MRRGVLVFECVTLLLGAMVSCSEPIKVHTREMDRTYLVVEGLITDQPTLEQYVKLSVSVPYMSAITEVPAVGEAEVVVSDGTTDYLFEEQENTGVYRAPEGFYARSGRKYSLSVRATVDGEPHQYGAEAQLPDVACNLEKIDYSYNGKTRQKMDSLWTVLMWGRDYAAVDGIYLVRLGVNGHRQPIGSSLMMEDKYFNGKRIEAFPVGLLLQTNENYKKYGESAKFLEEGDVLTADVYLLTPEYYSFMAKIQGDGGGTNNMPLMSSQPANPPTNLSGDGDVMGFFAACAVVSASCTVTDPFQTINYQSQ